MSLSKEKISNFLEKYILLIPIMFAIAVIPLIVRITYYDPELSGYSWFSTDNWLMDMFMYYKNQAIMLLDGVLVIGFVYLLFRKKLSMPITFLPLAIYFILVVFSSLASVAPIQTWNGFYAMLESAFAIFGYCMICYYAFAVIKSETQLKIIFSVFFVGVFILCAIGISQFFGYDFYMTDLGKDLIFPSKYAGHKDSLTLAFGEGRVYASLFNPNYVGVYACILMPLLVVLAFSAKKKGYAIFYIVLLSMVIVCLVGAKSKTAVLTIIPCMLFMLLYFGKNHWKKMIPIYLVSIIVFIGLNMLQGETSVVSNTVDRVIQDVVEKKVYELSDITLNDEDYTVTYNGETLRIKYNKDESDTYNIEIVDLNGNKVATRTNETKDGYALEDAKYEGLEFIFGMDSNKHVGFSIKVGDNKFFVFYSEQDKTYLYTNLYGRSTKLYSSETYDSFVFSLMGGFSGRGYIWSKSIPILKETLILGSGPDTYALMFPQYDYVSLIQNGWKTQLITKPHSMYLQTGIQTGVLSLIAFLVFNLWYIVCCFKLYYKRELSTFTESCGAGIFIATISFMIAGLVNDSTIGVSIIYWALLGIGFACNHMIRKQDVVIAKNNGIK